MSDMYLGSQAPLYQNVRIRCINQKTGKCRIERTAKNRVTRLMLWGISKFLSGEFNDSTPDKIYEYIPRYLALGTNIPGSDAGTAGVTTMVTVNDTRLLNEITSSSSTGETTSVQRIAIQSRQHMKTSTRFTDPFVKLSLSMYVSSHQFDNMEIGEAGLFSKQRDNNCVARVVFSPFNKQEDEIIEICWDITLLSYGETKYPDNIYIDEASKVVIPLYYSPYFIKSTFLNLSYIEESNNCGWLYLITSGTNIPIISVNETGKFELDESLITLDKVNGNVSIVNGSGYEDILQEWKDYLEANDIRFDNVIRQLILYGTKTGDNIIFDSSQTYCSMYFSEAERIIDNITLLADNEGALLQDSYNNFIAVEGQESKTSYGKGLYVSRIFKNEVTYQKIETNYKITTDSIIEISTKEKVCTIKSHQIFKLDDEMEIETGAYIENGRIMLENNPTEYVYDLETGLIYKLEEASSSDAITSAFIIPNANKFKIYTTTSYENVTNYTKYWIDWEYNKSVYGEEVGDTEYHITSDMYFATGDTHKLPYVITPTNATDKTVSWTSLNSTIAPVNEYGIVTGWNVGETYVTVTTSNGIKSRISIEVVKNLAVVKTSAIELTPNSITFDSTSVDPQYTVVTAVVRPMSATYNVVNWSLDANAEDLFSFAPLKDNKVKVWSNASGNIGRGYLIARTADGVSAKCLLQLLSNDSSEDDCNQDIHDDQHSS